MGVITPPGEPGKFERGWRIYILKTSTDIQFTEVIVPELASLSPRRSVGLGKRRIKIETRKLRRD